MRILYTSFAEFPGVPVNPYPFSVHSVSIRETATHDVPTLQVGFSLSSAWLDEPGTEARRMANNARHHQGALPNQPFARVASFHTLRRSSGTLSGRRLHALAPGSSSQALPRIAAWTLNGYKRPY